jgi:glycosyltransferase involved in cell wall biosynthesis
MTLWFDVDDLVAYFNAHQRPSGIQRLCFELYREVWRLAGHTGDVRFCRHDLHYARLIEIDWPALQLMITEVTAKARPNRDFMLRPLEDVEAPAEPEPVLHTPIGPPAAPLVLRRLSRRVLSTKLRFVAGDAFYAAASPAAGYLAALRAVLVHFGLSAPPQPVIDQRKIDIAPSEPALARGDVLIALGSIWDPRFAPLLQRLREDYGIRFATIVYDLIPDLFPEFTGPYLTELFRFWLCNVVPRADRVFTLSRASAHDLRRVMARRGLPVPEAVILPPGARKVRQKPRFRKTMARPFILFVSTIEPRKNHALLLAVWERLLASMAPERVPDLVFAGRLVGGMVERFNKSIGHPDLRARVKIMLEPDDQQLAALYAGCLFTVFPSLYEGWGLPVGESLGWGKPVAASNRSSIPEAGGAFCAYFDPENVDDATAVIRDLIETPERVAELKRRIKKGFRPPSWADTAAQLLGVLASGATAQAAEKPMARVG